jgi:hypothetical protein
MSDRLQVRRDNASVWASINPVLSDGEFGFERDTNLLKIGNGSTPWNNLPYIPLVGSVDSLTMTARNNTGSTIVKGSVVYISGATGNKPTIALSQAHTEATSSRTFGVVRNDIINNADGVVVIQGSVPTLNTSTFSDGDYVYLSPSIAGGLTNSRPVQPNHTVTIGVVTRAHPSLGIIEVRVQNGFEIEELHNVLITNKVTNDSVVYDSSTELWKNIPVGAAFATAGEDLGGHRVVISSGGNLYYANTTNLLHKNRVVGLTLGAVSTGVVSSYLKEGLITEPSWAWNTSLPVYLADNGLLTQTPVNVTGFVMIVGMPASSTSLYISFQPPIIL